MNTERATQLWNDTTVLLNRESGRSHSSLSAMFSALVPLDINDDELVLSTANLFTKDWVERRLSEAIHEAIWSVSGVRYGFRIVVSPAAADAPADQAAPAALTAPATQPSPAAAPAAPAQAPATLPVAAPPAAGDLLPAQHNAFMSYPPAGQLPVTATAAGRSSLLHENSLGFSQGLYRPSAEQPPASLAVPPAAAPTPAFPSFTAAPQAAPAVAPPATADPSPSGTSLSQTFETFVVGEANKRAFDMAYCVAEASGYIINPLFIYGKSGLGKTHLLLSIRHYIQSYHPELSVLYIQTSDLVADYSQSARRGDFSDFNNRFSSIDVFLLDDVQLLERRVETTNTVFDVFNRLTSTNRQVVLSADRSPDEIDLHERYLSRFKNGATADIQPPSFETKLTIFSNYLDYRCRRFGRDDVRQLIRPDVVEYIVSLSGSNIRELEGAATNLVWTLCSEGASRYLPISIEEAGLIVSSHFRRSAKKTIDISLIQKEVEDYFRVGHSDILSAKRSQDVSYPRQVAMYLCRLLTGTSLPAVGNAFNKDHTAVMYACNNIEKKRLTSPKVNSEIKQLIDNITG